MQAGGQQPAHARLCHDEWLMPGTTAAAILAGGQARRFGGQDKSRLVVHGRSIIVRQLEVLQRVAQEIFIVAPDAGRFADLNVQIHADLVPGTGALGGLYTALEMASADQVIVVACDLPFLHAGLLARLAERAPGGDGAWVKTARGVEPFFACYRRDARGVMLRAIREGRLRIVDLEQELRMVPIDTAELEEFGAPEELLANVNAADDYERIK